MNKFIYFVMIGISMLFFNGCSTLEKIDVGTWISSHASAIGSLLSSNKETEKQNAEENSK